MSIKKTGVWTSEIEKKTYLINNFTETKNTTNWTLGGTINSNGVAVLTGTSPNFNSSSFIVAPNDIIVVEFNASLPTPSTGNDGLFIGSTATTASNRYYFDNSTQTWGAAQNNANSSWNTYFLSSYNISTPIYIKSYIIGSEVNINDVPPTITTNSNKNPAVIQYTDANTSVAIRPGYNGGNTSMIINIWNFKVYKLNSYGISELNTDKASLYKGGINAPQFYEI